MGPSSVSRWHRVDAAELWIHVDGGPLELRQWSDDSAAIDSATLGSPLTPACVPQSVVPEGCWQQAVTGDRWSLMSCVVVPEFQFSGFELAPEGWSPPFAP